MSSNAVINLSDLDGSNGFVLYGIDASDLSGFSVSSAGDVNGDGVDDLIIGAPSADSDGNSAAGESYVVFGHVANTAPDAVDDAVTAVQNTPKTFLAADLLANDSDADGDPLTLTEVGNATNGTVALDDDGNVVFTPDNDFSGTASFEYTLGDGTDTDTALVTVEVGDALAGGNRKQGLIGTAGDDVITGGNGKDTLLGNAGDDLLVGGNGKDTLIGGLGNDTLTGGNGPDTFVLAAGEGTDTITDFSKADVIGLAGGLDVGDLSFSGSNIILSSTDEVLATLTGVDTTTLNTRDFTTI